MCYNWRVFVCCFELTLMNQHLFINTTLHPNHPLKICGIWPKSVVFGSIWNLAFKHHWKIWNLTLLRLLRFQIFQWCLSQIPNSTLRRSVFALKELRHTILKRCTIFHSKKKHNYPRRKIIPWLPEERGKRLGPWRQNRLLSCSPPPTGSLYWWSPTKVALETLVQNVFSSSLLVKYTNTKYTNTKYTNTHKYKYTK